jgi:pimeloyl-ACP methyl ester carboxylesterase
MLYLHGFASGPGSSKGIAIARHYEGRGVAVERLDLRVPSLEHLRLSAMISSVLAAIGGERERVVLFGSSLGGLTAARVAERDARVFALVLLAPAFRFPERWREKLGRAGVSDWERTGWLAIDDYRDKRRALVDYEFLLDADRVEAAGVWPDVRVPTLIVHGVHDDVVAIDSSRAWSLGKHHVRLVEVDDGHDLGASIATITGEADAFLTPFLGAASSVR